MVTAPAVPEAGLLQCSSHPLAAAVRTAQLPTNTTRSVMIAQALRYLQEQTGGTLTSTELHAYKQALEVGCNTAQSLAQYFFLPSTPFPSPRRCTHSSPLETAGRPLTSHARRCCR